MGSSRRGFLQSSAAFLIGPGLLKPSLRIRIEDQPQGFERIKCLCRVILDPLERLQRYQSILINGKGGYFKGPKITKVEVMDTRLIFTFEDCIMQEAVESLTLALYSPDGEFRVSRIFCELIRANPGDTLKVTYMIGFSVLS